MAITYRITFFSYWAVGSGKGGGYGKDSIVLKDKDGLPMIPGRTLRGLLRDAATECGIDPLKIIEFFGHENKGLKEKEAPQVDNKMGLLRINSAYLEPTAREILKTHKYLTGGLYATKTNTELGKDKQAEDHSLRKMEVTVPVTMEASIANITLNTPEAEDLRKAMNMLRLLGEKRHRGLGRCKLEIIT